MTGRTLFHSTAGAWGKRLLDLGLSTVALAVLWPVMGATALAVRVVLGSPVLFRSQRPGLHGIPFEILKFRTMEPIVPGKDESDAARLTAFGQFLRRTSLDELPELVNVLRGDMSLVGPRPLLMVYLPLYTREQRRRHEVRPGITGLAQVSGRNTLIWEQKFALDIHYVDNAGIALDLKILLLTAWRVLTCAGVSQPGHVTAEEFCGGEARPLRR